MKGPKHPISLPVLFVLMVALCLVPAPCRAQTISATTQAKALDAKMRSAILETVIRQINKYYVDPDLARKMAVYLRDKRTKGEYDPFVEQRRFLDQLTTDLRTVSHDYHLGVWPIEMSLNVEGTSEADKKRLEAIARYNNYGVSRATRLHGNIGYLDLTYFEDIPHGGDTMVAAMNLLANSDALIIDVRRNGGGSEVVNLLMSYLFSAPVHTLDIKSTTTQTTDQTWTMAYVPGPRLADIPVYILQSRQTASAAEALAYVLKVRRRAILVGETTRGAANQIEEFVFPKLSICMAVSAYRVSSPVTGTSWEGVGVAPDIAVPAEKALDAAGVEAMKMLLKTDTDDDIKRYRGWALEMYQARLDPVNIGVLERAQYQGPYGSRYAVESAGDRLILSNLDRMPITLIPLGNDKFAFQEVEGEARFVRDNSGTLTGLVIMFADGFQKTLKKGAEN